MNFAHMIGEHHYHSLSEQLSHIVTSWAGFIATIIIGIVLGVIVYKQLTKPTVKQRIKK